MAFVDEAVVTVTGGRGGNGSASFHSEPFKPRGGADGGNGGPGGSVVLEVSRAERDLSWLADHPHQRAASGKPGRRANRHGAAGADLVVPVPDGTVVSDDEDLVADLVGDDARVIVARGGRGGRGNASFVGPRNRAPRTAEAGEQGEERRLRLELRTVADVGLVGLPNAGKSTLLSRLTAARPKIADYAFTTLTPNLGVADAGPDRYERYVVADIPGLIEGASVGRGLGHRFLRHVMRCRVLVLVVDLSAADPAGDLAVLRGELEAYDPELAARPNVLVGTKADLVDDAADAASPLGAGAIVVSSVSGEGIDDLRTRLTDEVVRAEAAQPERRSFVVLRPGRPRFTVAKEGDRWLVRGRGVERWVLEADLEDPRAVRRLQERLAREGVERTLAAMGARRGDEVVIAERAFEFFPGEPPADDQEPGDGR
jgi:GTP-binding protein